MSVQSVSWILLGLAFIAANLPWLTEKFFFVLPPPGGVKKVWMRLIEWVILLLVMGLIAIALEHKLTGVIHDQEWEFYAVGVCLFLVFALPGFIYRHELSR
ncbi:MAG: DUF2818 family protein [Gammaproteobacteria bacterium]|nr:DUF2818 family protein [Gammaproteobacteria bacterium]